MSFTDLDNLLSEVDKGDSAKARALPVVLLIDDDEIVRDSLSFVLRENYTVQAYANAKDGVAAMHDEVCVVVLDIKMKGHDGFWACEQIRKQHPNVPVIFYSAYQKLKDPYEIINQYQPFGYLTKGEDHRELLRSIERAVNYYGVVMHNNKTIERLKQVQSSMRKLKDRRP